MSAGRNRILGAALVFAAASSSIAEGAPRERSQIAVARADGGLALITPQGRHVATLTRHRGWIDTDPAWSADGERLAFTRTKNGNRSFQVYVMNADGTGVRRVTRGRFDWRPAWSPDGRWIAYQSTSGIRLVRPDGTAGRRVPTPDDMAAYPSWTPDGRVAYAWHAEFSGEWPAVCGDPVRRCGWVWTSLTTGSDRRALVRGRDAHWTLDGDHLVFTPPDGGVATAGGSGGQPRLLGRGYQPDWSPDGERIVYARMGPRGDATWIMRRDGSRAHRIADRASMPAWRPR